MANMKNALRDPSVPSEAGQLVRDPETLAQLQDMMADTDVLVNAEKLALGGKDAIEASRKFLAVTPVSKASSPTVARSSPVLMRDQTRAAFLAGALASVLSL